MVAIRFFILFLFFCSDSFADSFVGVGEARVFDNNLVEAKIVSAKNAIREIILKAGLSASTINELSFSIGYLGDIIISNNLSRPSIRINSLSSDESDGIVLTFAKVDVDKSRHQCGVRPMAKSVVFSPLLVGTLRYAVSGGFKNEIDTINRKFINLMKNSGVDFFLKGFLNNPVLFDNSDDPINSSARIREIAERYDAQYLISGALNDISLSRMNAGPDSYRNVVRNFSVTFSLFDGITGNRIKSYSYKESSPWPIGYRLNLEFNDASLSNSAFGSRIFQILMRSVEDISSDIKCARLRARVIESRADSLMISAGTIQGVNVGDSFVLHNRVQSGFDSDAQYYRESKMSPYFVLESYPSFSLITSVDTYSVDYTAGVGDIVVHEGPP
ncbi:flagella assembly protein FlgT middle domain-containing protein [Marinobacter maritimus]|uniref:flagella assembly protein FlgT middle domain-containing protein n=1 Tax=Marinobacter maritimus TaxID=277961 RepID=UPI0011A6000F|nr:flagella assembly protein FlgT middle domain-containing protein [Marinobacter maritimus]